MTRKLVFINDTDPVPNNLSTTNHPKKTTKSGGGGGIVRDKDKDSPNIDEDTSDISNKKLKYPHEKTLPHPLVPPPPLPQQQSSTTKSKIITSFEELGNLKARSRIPIDIHHPATANSQNPQNCFSSTGNSLINDIFLRCPPSTNNTNNYYYTAYNELQNNQITSVIETSSSSSSYANSVRLRTNLPLSASINFSSLTKPTNEKINTKCETQDLPAPKYFSLMTTNKLFSNYASHSNLKMNLTVSTQKLDTLVEKKEQHQQPNQNQQQFDDLTTGSLSSSSNSCDSGCGCSLARSSILSQSDFNQTSAVECADTSSTHSGSFTLTSSEGSSIGCCSSNVTTSVAPPLSPSPPPPPPPFVASLPLSLVPDDLEAEKARVKNLCEKYYNSKMRKNEHINNR